MTDFQDAVLGVITTLRQGEVVTYGEVADQAGFPGAARAVGTVLRTCDGEVPWWRVVGAGGQIRTPIEEGQADRLRAEGVLVIDGRVEGIRNR
ncbi:MAG TPA: MGMT family protein [Acidimicrobiia bacterium]|nr:MGMT family protein [Acidimicrobiia bacterium]